MTDLNSASTGLPFLPFEGNGTSFLSLESLLLLQSLPGRSCRDLHVLVEPATTPPRQYGSFPRRTAIRGSRLETRRPQPGIIAATHESVPLHDMTEYETVE